MANLPERGAIDDNSLHIIDDGGVIIEGEKISDIGSFSELNKNISNVKEIEFPSILLPGFIDSHTHVCHYGSRSDEYSKRNSGVSYQQILEEGGGIHNTMNSTSNSTDDQLKQDTLRRLKRHFLDGVLTCEVKSGYAPNLDDEIRMLQIINEIDNKNEIDLIPTCLAAHVTPKSFESSKSYLDSILNELLPKIKEDNLSNRVDIFIEENAFSVSEASTFLDKVKNNFSITAHANQFTSGGVKVGVDNGAVSVDHLEVITDKEINYLSKSETTGVVLPGCSLGLGIPFAPARKLLDNNCKVSIASDWNPGSAPMGDLLIQAALLGSLEKLSNAEVLAGITCRSANALSLEDRGSLEKGKIADMIGFETNNFKDILYNQGKLKPSFICKRGKIYN
ncbi:MAG: imidazolonepropionase [Rhodothermaeota bacterium MED-G19]|nr:MAG: imidazolonepropionase [Rhodothermaeota bacterium MED-G19]